MLTAPEAIQFDQIAENTVDKCRKDYPDVRQGDDEARKIGEDNVRRNLDFLVAKLTPENVEEIIRFVHIIANPFLDVQTQPDQDYATRYKGGQTRNIGHAHAAIGQHTVPPTSPFIPDLFKGYCELIGKLLPQASTKEDFTNLAIFSYLELITIHPFPDGNGRTCRLMTEVIRAYGRKKLGISTKDMRAFPKTGPIPDAIEVELQSWQKRVGFFRDNQFPFLVAIKDPIAWGAHFQNVENKRWDVIRREGIKNINNLPVITRLRSTSLKGWS